MVNPLGFSSHVCFGHSHPHRKIRDSDNQWFVVDPRVGKSFEPCIFPVSISAFAMFDPKKIWFSRSNNSFCILSWFRKHHLFRVEDRDFSNSYNFMLGILCPEKQQILLSSADLFTTSVPVLCDGDVAPKGWNWLFGTLDRTWLPKNKM